MTLLARRSLFFALVAFVFACAGTASAQETGIGAGCDRADTNQPQMTLEADTLSVMAGTRVRFTATGRGAGGEEVEYMWRADQGRIYGRGTSVEFDTTDLAPGRYDVTLIGRGRRCGISTVVKTVEIYGFPPGLNLSANNVRVKAGEVVTVSADGLAPGLNLSWTVSEGRLTQSGNTVSIDTAGLTADTITVRASVDNIPDCTRDITIAIEKPPVLLPDILNFPMTGGRLNNANKAVLDDVSLRGGQDIRSTIIVTGKSSANERAGLARQRAENARNYLVNEKGVDPSRITIRVEEQTAAEGGIEIAIVPPGAQAPY